MGTTKEAEADATGQKAEQIPNVALADANTAPAEETAETREAPIPSLDAAVTEAEEAKTEEPATEEAPSMGQEAESVAETGAADKAESALSVGVAGTAVAGKQGG